MKTFRFLLSLLLVSSAFAVFLITNQVSAVATDVKNDASLSTSLVSYWELEETSGTRVDSHGSNDLADFNTVTSVTGIQGNAADFERSTSEYLEITDASQTGLDITSDLSIACWVRFENDPTNITYGLVNKFSTSGSFQYIMAFQNSGGTDFFRFGISSTGSNYVERSVTTWSPAIETWYHIGVAYDASAGSTQFYVNGSQSGSTQTGYFTSIANTGAPFTVGNDGNHGVGHDGELDECGIWSKVLTSTEFSDLYNSGAGIPYDAGGGGGVTPRGSFLLFH